MLTPTGVTVAEYNTALSEGPLTHARITYIIDNVSFTDSEISQDGLQLSTYMNPDESMRFGVAYSDEIIVHLLRSEKTDSLNFANEFTLEMGVDINGTTNWVMIGHFIGKKVTYLMGGIVELLAYDKMCKFDTVSWDDFVTSLTFPMTLGSIYNALCAFVAVDNVAGDEIADVMARSVTSIPEGPDKTCRDMLATIAEANGCYAKMTSDGSLKLEWFHDHTSDQEMLLNQCFAYEYVKLEKNYSKKWLVLEGTKWKDLESVQWSQYDNNSNPTAFTYIRSVWEEQHKEVIQPERDEFFNHRLWANAENYQWKNLEQMKWRDFEIADDVSGETYTIYDNPFILYGTDAEIKTHLQLILDRLYLFHLYYVATVTMVGNWLVEPGDIVTLEIEDGVYTQYPVFNRIIRWNGYCECDYETTGSLSG